jgi:catechol 2,3-dioxygenase-like lactoylglutathione lyase family enzyme
MKLLPMIAAALLCTPLAAQEKPARPKITGIASATIYVKDHDAALTFYSKWLDYKPDTAVTCDPAPAICVGVNVDQRIEIVSPSSPQEGHFLGEVAFRVDDIEAMRSYLLAQHITASEIATAPEDAKRYKFRHFETTDPDGHKIGFIEYHGCVVCMNDHQSNVSSELIHAGFVVKDRAAEDHFYKDILGFRPYWHGGMKDTEDSWVAMQVPDGKEWVEYMLNISPTADHHTLGVMNHIALGVTDIHAAKAQLIQNGWKPGEEPKLGRDGKWQLNLYDPDETRIEFMEFTPKEKPCCSDFTGPHPGPKP